MAETVDVPAPKERGQPMVPKPKYGPDEIRRFLGLADPTAAPTGTQPIGGEVEEMVASLLRGNADWLS